MVVCFFIGEDGKDKYDAYFAGELGFSGIMALVQDLFQGMKENDPNLDKNMLEFMQVVPALNPPTKGEEPLNPSRVILININDDKKEIECIASCKLAITGEQFVDAIKQLLEKASEDGLMSIEANGITKKHWFGEIKDLAEKQEKERQDIEEEIERIKKREKELKRR